MNSPGDSGKPFVMDGLQYAQWSDTVFRQMRGAGVDAVHATILYHGSFRDAVDSIGRWNRRFRHHAGLILPVAEYSDLEAARETGRTAIILGMQNPSAVEDDIGLIEILHRLGVRFMQLTYNNQSLFGSGYMESADSGITRMGREALNEMNRLGIVADLSHAAPKTALEAIECSSRPVAITHANPQWWHPAPRNIPDSVLKPLFESGGMLGLSLYPLHLKGGSDCGLAQFCEMAAETADRYGIDGLGIGSDLCQGRPASALHWMRAGRWSLQRFNEAEDFPHPPVWFQDSRGFANLSQGLRLAGFSADGVAAVLGENWRRFLKTALAPLEPDSK